MSCEIDQDKAPDRGLRRKRGRISLQRTGRTRSGLCLDDPQVPGIGIPGSGHPGGHPALHDARKKISFTRPSRGARSSSSLWGQRKALAIAVRTHGSKEAVDETPGMAVNATLKAVLRKGRLRFRKGVQAPTLLRGMQAALAPDKRRPEQRGDGFRCQHGRPFPRTRSAPRSAFVDPTFARRSLLLDLGAAGRFGPPHVRCIGDPHALLLALVDIRLAGLCHFAPLACLPFAGCGDGERIFHRRDRDAAAQCSGQACSSDDGNV